MIGKYGVLYLKNTNPELVGWIEEDINEFYYYTEIPDIELQDWCNHNYDFGDYGYEGGPPDRCGPDAVEARYNDVVGNLTEWVNLGEPAGSELTSAARQALGLLTHYLGDLAQPLHTDDDASPDGLEHGVTCSGRIGDYNYRSSYHSCYEKATDRGIDAYEIDMAAISPNVATNVTPYDKALALATLSNMGDDGVGRVAGYEGQDVGDHYQEVLDEIVYGFDNKIVTYQHGYPVEGTTDQLYEWTVNQLRNASASLGEIIYSAAKAAGVTGSSQVSDNVMYVSAIDWDHTYYRGINSRHKLEALITILDTNGNPVSDASVTIEWVFPDGSSTIMTEFTDSNGVALFVQDYVDTGTHTVTVTDVTKSNWIYDSTLNVETTDSYTI
jgi:hypothetical protein